MHPFPVGRNAILTKKFIVISAIWVLTSCNGSASPTGADKLSVEVVAVQAGGGSGGQEKYPAVLHRDREARLAFRIGGMVRAIAVRPGDRLGAGAVVARIDDVAQAAAVRRAEAEVARLERAAGRADRLARAGSVGKAQAQDAASALVEARAALTAARHDLAGTVVRMPFAGTVLQRHAEVGEVIAPGSPVATVIDRSAPLVVVADIPAERVARLRPGAQGWLRLTGRAEPTLAAVRKVPGGADPATGTARVELLPQSQSGLMSGQSGSISFADNAVPARPNEGIIPVEALLWAHGRKAAVYLIDSQSRARSHDVRVLGIDGDKVRITGLAPGTRVVTTGAGFAREGQLVEVSPK